MPSKQNGPKASAPKRETPKTAAASQRLRGKGVRPCHELLAHARGLVLRLAEFGGSSERPLTLPGVSMAPKKRGHDPIIFGKDPIFKGS